MQAVACGGAFGGDQTAWTRRHTAVLTSTGRLAVWGHGYYGQLGTGRIEDRPAPTLLGGALADARVCAVACGDRHTACASADGRLYTWGDGSLGALGHGDTDGRLQPAEVRALSGVKRVAVVSCCADHTAVCTADGCVYTWGAGAFGQLGHGDTGSKLVPCQVLGELRGRHVATVATGNCHTAALTKEGHLFAWGDATFGQLGLGGTEGKLAPQRVGADLLDLATKSVACGHYHTVAATRDGLVFAWGDNQQGQLGLGCREGRRQPSRVAGRLAQHTARAVACGDCHSVVLTEADERGQRRVLSFGSGTFGQTGLGHTHDTLEPTEVEGLPPASHVFALSCGATHTCVVTENWRVFAWGAVSGQDRIFREPSEVVDLAGNGVAVRATRMGAPPKSVSGAVGGLLWPLGDTNDLPWPLSLVDAALMLDREKKAREHEVVRRREVEAERDQALEALRALAEGKGDPAGGVARLSAVGADGQWGFGSRVAEAHDGTTHHPARDVAAPSYLPPSSVEEGLAGAADVQQADGPGPGRGAGKEEGEGGGGADSDTEPARAASHSGSGGSGVGGARLEVPAALEQVAGEEGDRDSVSSKGSHGHHHLEFV